MRRRQQVLVKDSPAIDSCRSWRHLARVPGDRLLSARLESLPCAASGGQNATRSCHSPVHGCFDPISRRNGIAPVTPSPPPDMRLSVARTQNGENSPTNSGAIGRFLFVNSNFGSQQRTTGTLLVPSVTFPRGGRREVHGNCVATAKCRPYQYPILTRQE